MTTRPEPGAEAHGDPGSRPRWAQLTYSSFDRHDGRGGGWQVKDTTGDPTAAEVEFLRARVQTQFDAGIDLPRFPTPAEIAELPRRLIQAPAAVHGGETALWHHVPAGNDASGRPGNVFAHVVLDRTPGAADPLRPIERWRSPGWLTPFGPEQVLAADLGTVDPPVPGPLNRQTIGSWLFAPRQWRLQILAVLLDGVRAAMAGGPAVVLGVDDVDEAANWIAAISFSMSAGTSRRFHFSTLERPTTLTEAIERELHLVCMPGPICLRSSAGRTVWSSIPTVPPASETSTGNPIARRGGIAYPSPNGPSSSPSCSPTRKRCRGLWASSIASHTGLGIRGSIPPGRLRWSLPGARRPSRAGRPTAS